MDQGRGEENVNTPPVTDQKTGEEPVQKEEAKTSDAQPSAANNTVDSNTIETVAKLYEGIQFTHPVIEKIVKSHPVFIKAPVTSEPTRDKMPYLIDPNKKMSIWSVLKDMIGKDFSKIAVPVWLNEPISMLQRLCEQLEYCHIIFKACQFKDSCLRMAYVMGFAFSQHCSTIGRHKKPFNPILGETYEYVPEDGSFKFIAEQVSHHPPISAGYAEAPEFEWWADTNIKTSFWGTCFEAMPTTSLHLVLKEYDDHYIYKRPVISLQNILVGNTYIENYGEMPFQNAKKGDSGKLILKKRGWGDKGIYETEGWIKNNQGKIVYKLEGKWDSYLKAINVETGEERTVWERMKLPEQYEEQYCFTQFTKQLNYLHTGLLPSLPLTDCRFRTDQRAFEYGDLDMARDEKLRLEEKQRARRKEMKAAEQVHVPKWFEEYVDPVTKESCYRYKGGYFECREKKSFGDTLDLYS